MKNHIDEPFFNELRTLKQMAYYLTVKIENTRGILGMYFILVSSTRDPANITAEIKTFVEDFFGKLETDLTGDNSDKLKLLKDSVFTKLNAPHNNLEALFDFIIHEVSEKTNYFNRKVAEEIRSRLDPITVTDLQQVWQSMKDKSLDLHVVSQTHSESYSKNEIPSTPIEEIKANGEFWEDKFDYWSIDIILNQFWS